ncbi:MAG: DUF523 domain-containing protein [Tissierellia bacterium]|nr:DUF523 domain-containing protein [Tissierellia bacterium]
MKIMVSACLLGQACKYNGGHNQSQEVLDLLEGQEVLALCPEVLGGLGTPRLPAEIREGRVFNREGQEVTGAFLQGAKKALDQARDFQPDWIILKSKSPSCGLHHVYDGSFSGRLVPGQGVFAQAAQEAGYRVLDTEDLSRLKKDLAK